MTNLVATLSRVKEINTEKAAWALASILMSGVALSVLPAVAGVVAYYSARKAGSMTLRVLAVAGAIAGLVQGGLAIL